MVGGGRGRLQQEAPLDLQGPALSSAGWTPATPARLRKTRGGEKQQYTRVGERLGTGSVCGRASSTVHPNFPKHAIALHPQGNLLVKS